MKAPEASQRGRQQTPLSAIMEEEEEEEDGPKRYRERGDEFTVN